MTQGTRPKYFRADNLDQAWELLAEAGGNAQAAWVSPRPSDPDQTDIATLVDLSTLGLHEIQQAENWLTIGAAATLTAVKGAESIQSNFGGVIARAVRKTAHHGLRNIATMGAVIEQPASAPELAAALLASDPDLIFYDGAEKTAKLSQVWQGSSFSGLPLRLKLDVGLGQQVFGSIHWVGRSPMDQAIITAASCVKLVDGSLDWLTLALAGDGVKAQRIISIEEELKGSQIDNLDRSTLEQLIRSKVKPAPSYRASADYQSHLAGTLMWRALETAIAEANKE